MSSCDYQHYPNREFRPIAIAVHSVTDRFCSFQWPFHFWKAGKPNKWPHLNYNHVINVRRIHEMCEDRVLQGGSLRKASHGADAAAALPPLPWRHGDAFLIAPRHYQLRLFSVYALTKYKPLPIYWVCHKFEIDVASVLADRRTVTRDINIFINIINGNDLFNSLFCFLLVSD